MSRFIEIVVGLLLMLSCIIDILGDLGFHEFPTTIHYALLLFALANLFDYFKSYFYKKDKN
ncbi:hypothetical protein OAI01_01620 [Alphaproteobacteria bacterium]|nr:hypothetical protein [Alphaproteobacteria bacterium]|tara:strand:+ start:199 stop:381 length:183 start_codon:yes stop_codon:yes gene_type:complete